MTACLIRNILAICKDFCFTDHVFQFSKTKGEQNRDFVKYNMYTCTSFFSAKLFSLVALFESLSTLAATSLYNNVYNATLNLYHGFCFLMGAALVLICIFISV